MRPRRFEIGSNRQSGRGIFDILHRIEKKYKIMGLHCKGYTRLFKKVSKPIKLKKKKMRHHKCIHIERCCRFRHILHFSYE